MSAFEKINTPKAKPLPPGVYTPVITLFDDTPEQGVDLEAMYKHCQYLINAGCHGLVYSGTNGEHAMTESDERKAIVRNARKAADDLGVSDYPIVAGISAQSTVETIKNAKAVAEAGAGWGLLLPPSYWPKAVTSDVAIQYYRDVADASPIPIVIYNFPGCTSGVDIDSDQIIALSSHPNIVATKLTCANVGKAIRVTAKYGPEHMALFGGSADYLIPGLTLGSVGCVVGMGNVFPKSVSRLYDLYKAGKVDEAIALQEKVATAEWACKKSISCTKYASWYHIGRHIGLDNERTFHMRKPYAPLNEALKKWTIDTLSVLEETEKSMPGREGIFKS